MGVLNATRRNGFIGAGDTVYSKCVDESRKYGGRGANGIYWSKREWFRGVHWYSGDGCRKSYRMEEDNVDRGVRS